MHSTMFKVNKLVRPINDKKIFKQKIDRKVRIWHLNHDVLGKLAWMICVREIQLLCAA